MYCFLFSCSGFIKALLGEKCLLVCYAFYVHGSYEFLILRTGFIYALFFANFGFIYSPYEEIFIKWPTTMT